MGNCDDIRDKLSAYLDGELTQQQSQKIALHLRECRACQQVCDDFRRMRESIRNLEYPEPSDQQWSSMMAGFTFKTTRLTGWLLWIGGAAVVLGYGLYEFLRDDSVHSIERIAVLALIVGTVLLFLTVLSERLSALKTDKYKDIEK